MHIIFSTTARMSEQLTFAISPSDRLSLTAVGEAGESRQGMSRRSRTEGEMSDADHHELPQPRLREVVERQG
jgi:hypothetical protein